MKKKKILFVCLGNICRSPAAEGIMKKMLAEQGYADKFFIDSAGILDYHQGELPDSRMREHACRRGYILESRSRPVTYDDFCEFDRIIGMDENNLMALRQLAPDSDSLEKISKMTDYCLTLSVDHVPDPYYGGSQGFENVLNILEDACQGLLENFKKE